MASVYDIMIIGGGPAGLSAASSIVRQGHKTVLFDSGKYRNAKIETLRTMPSWDHRHPAEFRATARADLEPYGTVEVQEAEVETIKKRGDGLFEATTSGNTWVAKKVILATGIEDILLDIPGYEDCWVKSIFHCLYCNGWEQRCVPSAGILAQGDVSNVVVSLHFARQALPMADQVTIYTNGNQELANSLEEALAVNPAPMTVDARKITRFAKGPERTQIILTFDDGTTKTEGFLAHKASTKLRGNLHEQLDLDVTPRNTIAVSPPFNQTSVKGVFAAGDCASPMQTYTAAMYSGSCTGGGAPLQVQAEMYNHQTIF